MEEYLLNNPLFKYKTLDAVLGAPISLLKKKELLEQLVVTDDVLCDLLRLVQEATNCSNNEQNIEKVPIAHIFIHSVLSQSIINMLAETERALNELKLKTGEIFALHECWYDDDTLEEKREFSELFTTYEAAIKNLKEWIKDEEWDENTLCWTMLEKWVSTDNGEMENTYTYYLINDEIVYFEREDNLHDFCGYVNSMSLNLPIPFKVGDIVTLNSIPFAPPKQAVLLEVENVDCCGVQILYRLNNGFWETGALKHGYGWGRGFPMLSALYRLSKFDGELKDEDKLMLEVHEYVRKFEKNGKALWNDFFLNNYCGESTANHENLIRSIIKNKTEAFYSNGDIESEGKSDE